MTIDNVRPDPIRRPDVGSVSGPYQGDREGPNPVRGPDSVSRVDRIEISTEGRALAAQEATDAPDEVTGLSPERIAEIRLRIEEGAYDALDVVDHVARRLLESGDL